MAAGPIMYPPPPATDKDVDALVDILRRRKCDSADDQNGWMSAEQIGFLLGWSDRKVRRVASKTVEIVSHPGNWGYKLEERATEDEVRHFVNGLISQGKTMIRRALRVKKHRRDRQLGSGLLPL